MKHDSLAPSRSQRMISTADELRQKLLDAADQLATCGALPLVQTEVTDASISRLLRARRKRGNFFKPELFADPAWDMLLELFAAELGQRRLSVTALCAGSGVPATTALRWLNTLVEEGLACRFADPLDGRRHYVSLSDYAKATLHRYFKEHGVA